LLPPSGELDLASAVQLGHRVVKLYERIGGGL